jgi:hypothetical protein
VVPRGLSSFPVFSFLFNFTSLKKRKKIFFGRSIKKEKFGKLVKLGNWLGCRFGGYLILIKLVNCCLTLSRVSQFLGSKCQVLGEFLNVKLI